MTPELTKHLSEMQTIAMQMRFLTGALNAVFDHPERKDIALCLVSCIEEMAGALSAGLDSVNLSKGGAA